MFWWTNLFDTAAFHFDADNLSTSLRLCLCGRVSDAILLSHFAIWGNSSVATLTRAFLEVLVPFSSTIMTKVECENAFVCSPLLCVTRSRG